MSLKNNDMISVDDYIKVLDCKYKDETYSVRDNGAIMRHSRTGMRARKWDEKWTFGKKNPNTAYMELSGERVHRIVAYAFHGQPISDEYVVDHIDTNRCNNRPENLRWVTRLDNALKNEITRTKIIMVCGSIEAFVNDPSILKGYESINKNFEWMRTVTPEEARISYERIKTWAKEKPESQGKQIADWIYEENRPKLSYSSPIDKSLIRLKEIHYESEDKDTNNEKHSLTANAIQVNWKIDSEFPLCPQEVINDPILEYQLNLSKDLIFCENNTYQSKVLDSVIIDGGNAIVVMTHSVHETLKPWAIARVTYENDLFVHENMGAYFTEQGALKQYTLLQGKVWKGDDTIDDYC